MSEVRRRKKGKEISGTLRQQRAALYPSFPNIAVNPTLGIPHFTGKPQWICAPTRGNTALCLGASYGRGSLCFIRVRAAVCAAWGWGLVGEARGSTRPWKCGGSLEQFWVKTNFRLPYVKTSFPPFRSSSFSSCSSTITISFFFFLPLLVCVFCLIQSSYPSTSSSTFFLLICLCLLQLFLSLLFILFFLHLLPLPLTFPPVPPLPHPFFSSPLFLSPTPPSRLSNPTTKSSGFMQASTHIIADYSISI